MWWFCRPGTTSPDCPQRETFIQGPANEDPILVLIHSPLVGPLAWAFVQEQLREKGFHTARPALTSTPGGEMPYWKQHTRSVAMALVDPCLHRTIGGSIPWPV
jgi:hypothetical protein